MYIHLHGHSHFSLLESLGTITKIINKIKSLNMPAVAINDYGNMYGALEFYKLAKKSNIKPIIGIEINLVSNMLTKKEKETDNYIVLLARNYEGYQNLLQIASIANLEGFYRRPRIDLTILNKFKNGLIGYVGCYKSQIAQMILLHENFKKIEEFTNILYNLFGQENFYLELGAQDYSLYPNFALINEKIMEIAHNLQIKLIVNNNFHYIEKEDLQAYEVLGCIKENLNYWNPNRPKTIGDYSILSEGEINEILIQNNFSQDLITQLFTNNYELSEQININIPLGSNLFPNYSSPPEIVDIYEKYKNELVI